MRWRTPIAMAALLIGLGAYVAVAATVAGALPDNWVVELLFYLVAGVLWVYPAVRVITWSYRDNKPA